MKWSYWVGNTKNQPVMLVKALLSIFGCHIDLHKFERRDAEGCFHTHPAWAIRIILRGGYTEEILGPGGETSLRCLIPLDIGIVSPALCHRVYALHDARGSWSLWLRGPIVRDVQLRGWGWPPHMRDKIIPRKGRQSAGIE